jgi:hypothetical protein
MDGFAHNQHELAKTMSIEGRHMTYCVTWWLSDLMRVMSKVAV